MESTVRRPQQHTEGYPTFNHSMVEVLQSGETDDQSGSLLPSQLPRAQVLPTLVLPLGIGSSSLPVGEISNLTGTGRFVAQACYVHDDGAGISTENDVSSGGNSEVPFTG